MRKLMKWVGRVLLATVVLIVVAYAAVHVLSERRMARVYAIEPVVPSGSGDPAAIKRGEHVATIRGCRECHGSDMGGSTFIDDALFARLSGPNLTPGSRAGVLGDVDFVRAVRHGVAKNGHSLLFMPSQEFIGLSEQDMADLLAYVHSLPAVDRNPPENRIGPVGRILLVADKVPLLPAEHVPHDEKPGQSIAGPTAEYGAYLASSCQGCHGKTFSGGHIPGTPPDWPDAANLTPDSSGLAGWTEADLKKVLREGISRDGRPILTAYMPVSATMHMTDEEISAVYAFLSSVPAKPVGNH